MPAFDSVDAYIQAQSAEKQTQLERVRKTVKDLLPETEELISYGVPAFKYHKRILIYYAAFKDHMSIFPASDEMIDAVGKKLERFRVSKGTLKFTITEPIPDSLLKAIIEFRAETIDKK